MVDCKNLEYKITYYIVIVFFSGSIYNACDIQHYQLGIVSNSFVSRCSFHSFVLIWSSVLFWFWSCDLTFQFSFHCSAIETYGLALMYMRILDSLFRNLSTSFWYKLAQTCILVVQKYPKEIFDKSTLSVVTRKLKVTKIWPKLWKLCCICLENSRF